eukprot:TRINITY_DN7552_c0_g1_i1.p1 TRINITY_DN7552_c0_g1~~TRINITY_DN7552_c0_g1_i1.p1  ORF type:complete len:469 (+),score=122.75 TRINITY_DN7552_c0_g1_i1:46-1407(+)
MSLLGNNRGDDDTDYAWGGHGGTSGSSLEAIRSTLSVLGEKVKTSSVDIGKKMSEGMNVVGGKLTEQMTAVGGRVKDLFASPTEADNLVDQATAEALIGPDWARSLSLCDRINGGQVSSNDAVKAIKRRLSLKHPHVQLLALILLETSVKNCDRMFSEVANEKVLDDMVKLVDDPASPPEIREKCLKLIEAWGESTAELRYLPVFEETYKSLKSRGVVFPGRDPESLVPIFTPVQSAPITTQPAAAARRPRGRPPAGDDDGVPGLLAMPVDKQEVLNVARNAVELLSTVLTSAPEQEALQDELTGTLVTQCKASRRMVQQVVQSAGNNDDESLMFEALSVHDELDRVLEKYAEMRKSGGLAPQEAAEEAEGGQQQPQPLARVNIQATEEAETPTGGEGELVRRRAAGATAAPSDDQAMKDLDDMIFGKGGGSSTGSAVKPGAKDKKEDDMIVF